METDMIRTILTPIDGSSHAQIALELGIDLAKKYGARMILLYVVTRDGCIPEDLYDAASCELMEDESDGGEAASSTWSFPRSKILVQVGHMLLRDASNHAKAKGVKTIEMIVDAGDARKRILYHAKETSADLIVMGRRGLGKLKRLAMGSVSHNVFNLAPCSCITVHHSDTQPCFERLKSILVPTDGSKQADKAVSFASDIASKYGANLTLAYVMSRGPSLEMLRGTIEMSKLSADTRDEIDPAKHLIAEHMSSIVMPPVVSRDALTEIGKQILERGQKTAEAKGIQVPKIVLLYGDDPARKILQVAKQEHADLIAMGSRGLGGAEGLLAGSVSYKVNHTAPCTCLIVR